MAYDFEALHAAVKAKIDAAGFEYETLGNWGDFQDRNFPSAMKNKGYAIIFQGSGISESELATSTVISIAVEFVFDIANDLYLGVLDDAVAAVYSLKDIALSTICGVQNDGDLTDFISTIIPKTDTEQGMMVVQFPNIRIDVEVA